MTPEKKREMRRRGATIRALREARGASPQQLANKVGIARPTLANIELGHRGIRPELLPKLADALDVPPSQSCGLITWKLIRAKQPPSQQLKPRRALGKVPGNNRRQTKRRLQL